MRGRDRERGRDEINEYARQGYLNCLLIKKWVLDSKYSLLQLSYSGEASGVRVGSRYGSSVEDKELC